ncbi:endospore germination permease [Bacillus sonorensis]|uniref:Spore germination protein GerAB n=2 Tax=Bacillus sonorensis TaxID=119858 RepID=M5NZ15_9BACI|nr:MULTISPECIES: endospore germination permease [Bacillus]TWK79385.1 Spore germination protein A2 [Bacillus paralicheniformis]ASB90724.1 Spore germination protein A2 [Bacillus sonorensis]EME73121.1 spore germination protein GerAB [Bacillus sonorensis L12]MCZ0073063.1 endospore germination permease [Bacillus sonorensis]MCZ0091685.1 endospore germination permease [Bacillus sonorensis]
MRQKHQQEQISSYAAASIITSTMLGAGLLTLPRALTRKTLSPDGWIALVFEGLVFILIIYMNAKIVKKHNVDSFFDYTKEGCGVLIGNIVNVLITLYFMGVASFEARAMAEMVKFFLLQFTPMGVTIFAFIICAIYLVIGGINDMSRVFPFFLSITIVILLTVYGLSLKMFQFNHLRPVLGLGLGPVKNALTVVSISFLGAELMLFLPKYLKNKEKLFKAAVIGFGIPAILYVLTFVVVVGALTASEVMTMIWPTISLFQSFEIRGIFIERFESFLLVIWTIQFFTTYVAYTYFAASGLEKVFGWSLKKNVLFIGAITFLAALWPKDVNEVTMYSDYLGYIFIIVFCVLPVLIFLLVSVKRRLKAS